MRERARRSGARSIRIAISSALGTGGEGALAKWQSQRLRGVAAAASLCSKSAVSGTRLCGDREWLAIGFSDSGTSSGTRSSEVRARERQWVTNGMLPTHGDTLPSAQHSFPSPCSRSRGGHSDRRDEENRPPSIHSSNGLPLSRRSAVPLSQPALQQITTHECSATDRHCHRTTHTPKRSSSKEKQHWDGWLVRAIFGHQVPGHSCYICLISL